MTHKSQSPARDGARQRDQHVRIGVATEEETIHPASTAQEPRLAGGYDKAFERKLTDLIGTVIREASTLPSGALFIRTIETLRALSTAQAGYLALLPDAAGSGVELRTITDDLAQGLFRLARATARRPATQRVRNRLQYLRDGEATR